MDAEMHVKIMGWLMLALAAANAGLPAWPRWEDELKRLSLLSRQVVAVHAVFIGLITGLMGWLAVTYAGELAAGGGGMARAVVIGLGVFWGARFLVQVAVCARRRWRGTGVNAVLHFGFALLCAYFAAVCAWTLARSGGVG